MSLVSVTFRCFANSIRSGGSTDGEAVYSEVYTGKGEEVGHRWYCELSVGV